MFEKQIVLIFLLLAVFSEAVLAVEDSGEPPVNPAVEQEEKKDENSKGGVSSTLSTIEGVVLSPAHYAVLLGGKLFPHGDKKSDTEVATPAAPESNVTRKWKHKLPFMAQEVIDMGFDLPNPYGFTGIFTTTRQDVTLTNLRISFGSDQNAPKTEVPFVTFQQSKTDSHAWESLADVWILPFLNAYLIGGRVDGTALVPIIVPGDEALKALLPALGALCDKPPGFPVRPEACDKDFVILDVSNYDGTTYGFGINLAAGWKNFFATIPMSVVWTHLNNASTRVKAVNISPRVGYSIQPKGTGMLSFYVGASYLNTEQDINGIYRGETGIPEIGEIDISYTIHQQGTQPWNYLAGFNWSLNPTWSVQSEASFQGNRKDFVVSVAYRW